MDVTRFVELAQKYNVIPVYERITADLLTPVLAFLKLRKNAAYPFLLESVEGIGRLARYSFIGKNPQTVFYNHGKSITIEKDGTTEHRDESMFDYLQKLSKQFNQPKISALPDFTGGIVGYFGYESVALIEDVLSFEKQSDIGMPDAAFGLYKTIVAFDHYKHQLLLITNVTPSAYDNPTEAFYAAKETLNEIKDDLNQEITYKSDFSLKTKPSNHIDFEPYAEQIEKCRKNIYEGDVFQIVYSKRFQAEYSGDLFNVYRSLRMINPSPYMYYMETLDNCKIIGTSPEDLLKVKDRKATILPIAGTRRRGKTDADDIVMEKELLADEKERAEHTMLVDLARNDLGRVCKYGTVKVIENMNIHRFSHVMHIVSRVEGELHPDKDCIDALKASFPAGTVSGAPKIRAMQLLSEYETIKRNIYAGAIGYVDFSGNLDMCISIRTLFAIDNTINIQAGGGIVADSQPKLEMKEIQNKSAVLINALEYAEVIDESSYNR